MKVYRGSNAAGRRKYRRLMTRLGLPTLEDTVPAFSEGQTVKITVPDYGVRYANSKGTVIGPATQTEHWLVKSARRAAPLTIWQGHLEAVA
jgi:hypothetical protein